MKKLFFAAIFAVITICSAVIAGNVCSYVPTNSQAVIFVDVAAILSRPEAVKLFSDPEVVAKQLEFSQKAGCSLQDLKAAVIAVGKSGNGVVLFEMAKKVDVGAALKNVGVEVTSSAVGKYTVFQHENRSAVCQLTDNIVVVGSPDDLKNSLVSKRGISPEMQELVKPLAASGKNVAWMIFKSGKSDKGSAVYGFCGKDNADHFLSASFIFKNTEKANQTAAMMPMYAGMFSGMIFNQNPQLGADVTKNFKVKTAGNKVDIRLDIPAALVEEIAVYASEQGKKGLLHPGAAKSEK